MVVVAAVVVVELKTLQEGTTVIEIRISLSSPSQSARPCSVCCFVLPLLYSPSPSFILRLPSLSLSLLSAAFRRVFPYFLLPMILSFMKRTKSSSSSSSIYPTAAAAKGRRAGGKPGGASL